MKKVIYITSIIIMMFILTSCNTKIEITDKDDVILETDNNIDNDINDNNNNANNNISNIDTNVLNILNSFHNESIYIKKNILIKGATNYYTNIYQSVSNILYEDLIINKEYMLSGKNGKLDSIDFITIHYTANTSKGADAKRHATYFKNNTSTSIHYLVGNDGIYQSTPDNMVAYHAGASSKMTWHKTGVIAKDNNKPTFGISNSGYFTINNISTIVRVPYETKKGYGYVTNSRYLNKAGLAYKIIDGEYYIGGTRWIYSQIAEGRICSVGGNNNSIGIETSVDEGSNIWYTYHKTAKLVASLLIKYNLDISRVVPHHIFTAKNCPQPLLDNNMELWNEFIKLVESEYIYQTTLQHLNIKFIPSTSILNTNSMYTSIPTSIKELTYTISYNNNKITYISNIK